MKLYVNTAALNKRAALCLNADSRTATVAAPEITLGDKIEVDLYILDTTGAYITTGTPRIGIGSAASTPAGGTFALSDGTATATALEATSTADALQTALNALNSDTGPGGDTVAVTSALPGIYTITWDTDGAQTLLTSTANNLYPDAQVIISRVRSGDSDTREVQVVRLIRRPAIYVHEWEPITNGWRAVLNANTTRVLQHLAASDTYPRAAAYFEIEHRDAQDRPITYVQKTTTIMAQTVDPNTLEGADLPAVLDNSDVTVPRYRLDITTLTGGADTALDGVATVGLTVGIMYIIGASISPTIPGLLWQLKTSDTRPDEATTIIHADDSTTRYWQLLGS